MHALAALAAAGHRCRKATLEELRFLISAGALKPSASKGWLISVEVAISACGKPGVGAPLLAAMTGFAKMEPYNAPPPQAQPPLAPPPGVACLQFQ